MTLARRFILDRWRTDGWWALGIVAMVAVNLAFFPGIKGKADLDQTLADLPPALKAMFGVESGISVGSAAGYLQAQLFSSVAPILLLVLAISLGSGAIGGAEEDGSAEFLLSYPVSRLRFLAGRFAGVFAVITAQTVVLLAANFALCPLFGALDGVSAGGLVTACLGCGALALLHASIAFAAGAWFGRRTPAISIASAVAAGGYVLLGLFSAIDAPGAIRNLTPWYWFLHENMLVNGPNLSSWLPACLLSLVIALAVTPRFLSRDLR